MYLLGSSSKIHLFCFILMHGDILHQGAAGDESRITSGQTATPHEFPFMVALHATRIPNQPWHHICGGALVTKRHVVTAAHCYNSTFNYSVVLGAHENPGRGEPQRQRMGVLKWHFHPAYNENSTNKVQKSDIAVLTLKSDAQLNHNVGVIALPKTDVNRTGEICTAIGWGRTSEGGSMPQVLLKAHLEILPRKTCAPRFPPYAFQSGTTCAYGAPEGTCSGDSGGPLVCKTPSSSGIFLFGVVSSGHKPCGGNDSLELYTRVGFSDHLNFVTHLTSQEFAKEGNGSGRFEISLVASLISTFMILVAGFLIAV